MFSYSRCLKSGHITCYSDRTYHVLLTVSATNHSYSGQYCSVPNCESRVVSDHTRLYHPVPRGTQWLPSCRICNDPVLLETSKTDEYGQAVHEECYVLSLSLKAEFLNHSGSVPGPTNRPATYQPCEATMAEDHICASRRVFTTESRTKIVPATASNAPTTARVLVLV